MEGVGRRRPDIQEDIVQILTEFDEFLDNVFESPVSGRAPQGPAPPRTIDSHLKEQERGGQTKNFDQAFRSGELSPKLAWPLAKKSDHVIGGQCAKSGAHQSATNHGYCKSNVAARQDAIVVPLKRSAIAPTFYGTDSMKESGTVAASGARFASDAKCMDKIGLEASFQSGQMPGGRETTEVVSSCCGKIGSKGHKVDIWNRKEKPSHISSSLTSLDEKNDRGFFTKSLEKLNFIGKGKEKIPSSSKADKTSVASVSPPPSLANTKPSGNEDKCDKISALQKLLRCHNYSNEFSDSGKTAPPQNFGQKLSKEQISRPVLENTTINIQPRELVSGSPTIRTANIVYASPKNLRRSTEHSLDSETDLSDDVFDSYDECEEEEEEDLDKKSSAMSSRLKRMDREHFSVDNSQMRKFDVLIKEFNRKPRLEVPQRAHIDSSSKEKREGEPLSGPDQSAETQCTHYPRVSSKPQNRPPKKPESLPRSPKSSTEPKAKALWASAAPTPFASVFKTAEKKGPPKREEHHDEDDDPIKRKAEEEKLLNHLRILLSSHSAKIAAGIMSVEHRGTKALELWTRRATEGYPGVNISNMTTSWRDGLAFCALIHHFRPDLIDVKNLKAENILENNALAFRIAEQHLGIPALLDAEDMVQTEVPDRLSILTYVSQFYQAFSALGLIGPGGRRNPLAANNLKNAAPGPAPAPASATAASSLKAKPISQPPSTLQTKTEQTGFKTDKVTAAARGRREECVACRKTVFLAERIVVGFPGQLRHRTCFRCDRCATQLTLASYYETEKGQFCCETCPDEERSELVSRLHSRPPEHRSSSDSDSDSDSESEEETTSPPQPPTPRSVFLHSTLESPPEKPPRSAHPSLDASPSLARPSVCPSPTDAAQPPHSHSGAAQPPPSHSEAAHHQQLPPVQGPEPRPAQPNRALASDEPREEPSAVFARSSSRGDGGLAAASAAPGAKATPPQAQQRDQSPAEGDPHRTRAQPEEHLMSEQSGAVDEASPQEPNKQSENEKEIRAQDFDNEENFKETEKGNESDFAVEGSERSTENVEEERRIEKEEERESNEHLEKEKIDERHVLNQEEKYEDAKEEKLPLDDEADEGRRTDEYPDELNPFGSDEEKPSPLGTMTQASDSPVPMRSKQTREVPKEKEDKKVDKEPTNPFDSEDDEEEEQSLLEQRKKKSMNPFESDDEESDTSCSLSSPSKGKVKPPRPPPPTLKRDVAPVTKKWASSSPVSEASKPAPPSPTPSSRSACSDQSTLRLKKKLRHAPAPPFSPPAKGEGGSDLAKGVIKDDALALKMQKDLKNHTNKMMLRSGVAAPKSESGEWRRKKGPAPSRPVPQKRAIRKLPMRQVQQELHDIEVKQTELERQGVLLETAIRDRTEPGVPPSASASDDSEGERSASSNSGASGSGYQGLEVEDMILQLFELVNEKNELFRRQTELMYMKREKRLEEEYAELEYQIRCLMLKPPSERSEADAKQEEDLIGRLVKVVEQRDAVVNCLEMERQREAIENESIATHMIKYQEKHIDGIESDEGKEVVKKKKKKLRLLKKKKKKDKEKSSKIDADKDVDETEVKKKKKIWFKKPLPSSSEIASHPQPNSRE